MKIKLELEIDSVDEIMLDGVIEAVDEVAEDYLARLNPGKDVKVSVNEVIDPFDL